MAEWSGPLKGYPSTRPREHAVTSVHVRGFASSEVAAFREHTQITSQSSCDEESRRFFRPVSAILASAVVLTPCPFDTRFLSTPRGAPGFRAA